jgi:hypothetical protein
MAKLVLNARQRQILAGTFDPTDLRRRYHEANAAWHDMRRARRECTLCGRKLKKMEGPACKRCLGLRRERQAARRQKPGHTASFRSTRDPSPEARKVAAREARDRLRAAGRCIICGKPRGPVKTATCAACLAAARARYPRKWLKSM